jgi:SAM-dependent methyltransferase
MAVDGYLVGQFYGSSRGAMACALLLARLRLTWPSLAGLSVLGLGYAAPYLDSWPDAERRLEAMPGPACLGPWAPDGRSLSCAVDEEALPFADLSLDRVLLVHGLEAADNARGMLREVWRVLKDDGRLLVVAPNRRGMWAHLEATPFGQGHPYSPGQIGRLLSSSLFRVERRDTALHVPPLALPPRAARAIESAGRWLLPGIGGLTIAEAVKDVYAAMPVARARRRVVLSRAA